MRKGGIGALFGMRKGGVKFRLRVDFLKKGNGGRGCVFALPGAFYDGFF
jgi:hypothetical protein